MTCSVEELRALWETIATLPPGLDGPTSARGGGRVVGLVEVLNNKNLIKEKIPALIESFEDIDVSTDGVVSWSELTKYAGLSGEWLECEFEKIIGLEALKDQIRDFHRGVLMDKARAKAGKGTETSGGKLHMQFIGNPGTGKTTMGRLIGGLLYQAGLIGSENFLEVQRDDLVAGHIGQTAPKTRQVVEKVLDGMLFVDEAYRLSSGGEKDFGPEVWHVFVGERGGICKHLHGRDSHANTRAHPPIHQRTHTAGCMEEKDESK